MTLAWALGWRPNDIYVWVSDRATERERKCLVLTDGDLDLFRVAKDLAGRGRRHLDTCQTTKSTTRTHALSHFLYRTAAKLFHGLVNLILQFISSNHKHAQERQEQGNDKCRFHLGGNGMKWKVKQERKKETQALNYSRTSLSVCYF